MVEKSDNLVGKGQKTGASSFFGYHGYRATEIPVDFTVTQVIEAFCEGEKIIAIAVELLGNQLQVVCFREHICKEFISESRFALGVDKRGNGCVDAREAADGARRCARPQPAGSATGSLEASALASAAASHRILAPSQRRGISRAAAEMPSVTRPPTRKAEKLVSL